MALLRLRHHPVISRVPSLLRARLLSSTSRSICRKSILQNSIIDDGGTLLRPKPFSAFNGVHDHSTLKFVSGIRCYSSSGALSHAEPPAHIVIGMPALSPTMTQGNIAKWWKKEGDKIEVGDIICEIETDKATLEFESLEEGFLAKILVPAGAKDVPVGQPIAITVEEEEDLKNIPDSVLGGTEVKETRSTQVKPEEKSKESTSGKIDASNLPPHIFIDMPALSPTMDQGNIARWLKKEGDKIEVGDIICEIETDKATLEFECLEEGYLAKILAPEGSKDVQVGQPIAITVEDPADVEKVKSSVSGKTTTTAKEATPAQHATVDDVAKVQKSIFKRISPSAKILIAEHKLDAFTISASGTRGTLTKSDVLTAIKSGTAGKKSSPSESQTPPKSQPQTHASVSLSSDVQESDSFEDIPNTQIRKIIAKRLLESKQTTPHFYLSADVILDPLLAFRKELKDKFGVKVSVNDIVIKTVAIALRSVPKANAFWDDKKGEIVLWDSVDISIAVATEKGLMTPIVKNADEKSISSISLEVKELAEKARLGKLTPSEFQGGSFSISNLGMFPVDQFCAIINPPQAGILAVGRGNQVVEPVFNEDGIEIPGVVTKMNVTLSADHRVFDGEVAGDFIGALKSNFNDIRRLLL